MSFGGVKQMAPSVSLENKDISDERDAIRLEIDIENSKLASLREQVRIESEKETKIELLSSSLATLSGEEAKLKLSVASLKQSELSLIESNKQKEKEAEELASDFDKKTKENSDKLKEDETKSLGLLELIKLSDKRAKEILEKNTLDEITFSENKVKNDKTLAAQAIDLEKNALELENITKKAKDGTATIESNGIKISEQNALILSNAELLKKSEEKIEENKTLASNLILEAEKKSAEMLEVNTKKEAELSIREAELSKKESWLLTKTETLRNTKKELEEYYNRPINNVIL
jgi:hypothetical protein